MNTTFSTSFIIFPEHTNHMSPIIFGGKFMAEMDLCAAKCVRRFLYDSETADASVTHKASFTFLRPTYLGDFIIINSTITEVGEKSIKISTSAFREVKDSNIKEKVAEAEFVFITIDPNPEILKTKPKFLPYINHNLEL